jgi:hypothetical protein
MDPDRALRLTALAYGAAIVVHLGDHLRRGVGTSPRSVVLLGTIALVFQAAAVAAAVGRHPLAPFAAVAVALPDALGVVAVHLLPRWSGLSDAFPGAPASANVTAFSWVTAIVEVATGLAFAYAGWLALRRVRARAA